MAGKTGTTHNNKDGWLAAATPQPVNITWVGNNNPNISFKSTSLGQGANTALLIFGKMYQGMLRRGDFNKIASANFQALTAQQASALDCKDLKRDGFFKQLFSKDKDKRKFRDEKKRKERFLQEIIW